MLRNSDSSGGGKLPCKPAVPVVVVLGSSLEIDVGLIGGGEVSDDVDRLFMAFLRLCLT